jgi:hypothetical protein
VFLCNVRSGAESVLRGLGGCTVQRFVNDEVILRKVVPDRFRNCHQLLSKSSVKDSLLLFQVMRRLHLHYHSLLKIDFFYIKFSFHPFSPQVISWRRGENLQRCSFAICSDGEVLPDSGNRLAASARAFKLVATPPSMPVEYML